MILIFSCESNVPLTSEEQSQYNDKNYEGPRILMDMSEDLILSIAVQNFDVTAKTIKFVLYYDYTKFTLDKNSFEIGDFSGALDNSMAYDEDFDPSIDGEGIIITFTGDVKGDGVLLKVNFPGSSSYDNTVIYIKEPLLLDAAESAIYVSCENSAINTQTLCLDSGYLWTSEEKIEDQGFYIERVCYIDKHPGNLEILFDGEYQWTNNYCYSMLETWHQ